MNIFFVGNLKSGFIRTDIEILEEDHHVEIFDISQYKITALQIPKYIFSSLVRSDMVFSSNLVWIWFADYHAVPFMLLAKLRGIPVVICQGDYEVTNSPETNYGNQRKLFRGMITRWLMRNANKCIVPSPIYEDIARCVEPAASICTIPCSVDIPCDVPTKKKHLVITSTISDFAKERKGIPLFEEIAATGMPCKMKVLVNAPRDEYLDALKNAKAYCQFSMFESFGVSLVEAMSYGCIPITTDRGALPWVTGGTGIIVPYGDLFAARKAILKAMTMDGSAARNQAMKFKREFRKESIRKLIEKITA
jgi:Glycosyl transferases group 1